MDVYKIGVSIALSNGVSPVLGIISKDLLGVHQKVKDVEGGFARWGTAVAGVAAIMGGAALLGAMGKLIEHGRELVHIQEQMRAAGLPQKEIAEATSKAWENTAKVQSISVTRQLEMIKELRGVFGDTKHAEEFALDFAKSQAVIDAVTHGANKDQVFEAAKAIELRGNAFDPEKFRHEIDMMTKAVTAYGGKVTPKDFFQFVKYTRGASFAYNDDFMWGLAPALIQELGPSSAGTALKSMDQAIVGGKLLPRAAAALDKIGLLDRDKVEWTKIGTIKSVSPGAVAGTGAYMQNPADWMQNIMIPALREHGIDPGNKEQVRTALSAAFGNRMAEQMSIILATQWARLQKEQAITRQGQGISAYDGLAAKDPTTIMKGFHEQWSNLLTALGSPMVEPAMNAMKSLTNAITTVSQAAAANPEVVSAVGKALGVLAGALVTSGVFAIGAAAFSALAAAPIAVAIGAVIGAAGMMAAISWDDIAKAADGAWKIIQEGAAKIADAIIAFGQRIWAATQSAISSFFYWTPGAPGASPIPGAGRGNPGSNKGVVPEAPTPKGGVGRQSYDAVPPPNGGQVAVAGNVYLDGKLVGKHVSPHVSRAIVAGSQWPSSSSEFDRYAMVAPPDLG